MTLATTMARRHAACVNAQHASDKARADGYRAEAKQLRVYADRMPSLPVMQETYRNAAALLDDWALTVYKGATA